jgi:hypothetical protein
MLWGDQGVWLWGGGPDPLNWKTPGALPLGLGMTVSVEDLGMMFTILNVYGPSQDHTLFWDNLLKNPSYRKGTLSWGGFEFLPGCCRIMGPKGPGRHTFMTTSDTNWKSLPDRYCPCKTETNLEE